MNSTATDTLAPGQLLIEDLARQAGTTVRNVRAYQSRGLLPPPSRRGRGVVYADAHLLRLRLIFTLRERGYSLDGIGDLLSATERGDGLPEVLGTGPRGDADRSSVQLERLRERIDQVARELVELLARRTVEESAGQWPVSDDRAVRDLVHRLVPEVQSALEAELSRALARHQNSDSDGCTCGHSDAGRGAAGPVIDLRHS